MKKGLMKDEVKFVLIKCKVVIIWGLEEVGGFGGKVDILVSGEFVVNDFNYFKIELKELVNIMLKKVKVVV